jgi:hypothetical protein
VNAPLNAGNKTIAWPQILPVAKTSCVTGRDNVNADELDQ